MSNFGFDIYNALNMRNDACISNFNTDVGLTATSAIGLMTYTTAMTTELCDIQLQMVMASMDPDPGQQMLAQSYQELYNSKGSEKDTKCTQIQSQVKLGQQQTTDDNQNRTAAFNLAEGFGSFWSAVNGLVKQKI